MSGSLAEEIEKFPKIFDKHLHQVQTYSKEEQKSLLENVEAHEKYKYGHKFRSSIKKKSPISLLKYVEEGDNKIRLARSDPEGDLEKVLVQTFDLMVQHHPWGLHSNSSQIQQMSGNLDFASIAQDLVTICKVEAIDINDVNILVNGILSEAVRQKGQLYERDIIRPIIKKKHDLSIEGAGAVKYSFKIKYDEGQTFCFRYQKIDIKINTLAYYVSPYEKLEDELKKMIPNTNNSDN